ncbi:helix-turn-helix domain-containing protein [Nocardia nova]|uniref:helix-turn-helix domain-containing protein n=1 Tax=Nocardia nova TaxID=37330 RepID=UPI0033D3BC08
MHEKQRGEGDYIGQRVRTIRARRGITQQVLADRIGKSRGSVAKWETGERLIDSRSTLLALASALGVNVADLTGLADDRLDPAASSIHAAAPEIETALWAEGDVTDIAPPRPLVDLTAAVLDAERLSVACDYTALGPRMAPLITDCHRHVRSDSGADRERAQDALASITHTAASVLRSFGHTSLAWTAASAAENAARETGGTAGLAAVAFTRSQLLLSRPGGMRAALTHAETTAECLGAQVNSTGEIELCGMLRLQSGLVAAAMDRDADPYFAEAADQATRLADAAPGQSLLSNPTFGRANVTLWRMSAAMERRDAGQVLTLAPTLPPNDLPSTGRRAQYFVEIGRAHAQRRSYRESVHALLRAEHTAPQKVRNMSHVRELVGYMMRTARRDLTTGELGRLAQRVGAVPA